ncbi:F-box family protein with DUF295, partial [Prunus dulcis]
SQWHNRKNIEVGSIKTQQLSLLARKNGPPPSRARWRRLRAPLATGPVALEPPSSPLSFPTDPLAAGDLCWPKTAKERPELIQNHRNFKASDLPPPATIFVDPEVQSTRRRDLRRAVDERKHPPPGHP